MGKKNRNKRKNSSEGDSNKGLHKTAKHHGSSTSSKGVEDSGESESVSESLKKTNSVLYGPDSPSYCFLGFDNSVFSTPISDKKDSSFQLPPVQPSINMDPSSTEVNSPGVNRPGQSIVNINIIEILNRIESKISDIERKLSKLDSVEQKVQNLESEVKKIWVNLNDINKSVIEKLSSTDDRADNLEFSLGKAHDAISSMGTESQKLKESVTYLQSQSMRNNLIFCNIPESTSERNSDTEAKVRSFVQEKLCLASDYVEQLRLERAHRMGPPKVGYNRKIVCKSTLFTDREIVRRQRVKLHGTEFYVHEQFPPEIVAKRQKLYPLLKKAKQEQKQAWISYDTLYVE